MNPRRLLAMIALVGCEVGMGSERTAQRRSVQQQEVVSLPQPRRDGASSLEVVLNRRRSVRSFTGDSLTAAQIGQLFWAAQGITDPQGLRTAPSAGALYPLECYVAIRSGVYHYLPAEHRMARIGSGDIRRELADAAFAQEAVADAPAVFIVTATYERTARKYGRERAQRYATLEAGHATQNLLLEAVALGLGAVPVGAFNDQAVARLLELQGEEAPLYLVPAGHPRR